MPLVGEDRAQHARRRGRLERAVKICNEVGRGEMHTAVGGVGEGLTVAALATHIAAAEEHAASSCGASRAAAASSACSLPEKPSARKALDVRALVRWQHRLHEATVGKGLHLGEPLQRRAARVGRQALVALRGEVARGQATVVVGRPG